MQKTVLVVILVGIFGIAWPISKTEADVVIKVRALNPLDTTETAIIHYPLPKEISQEDILKQKITYSLDHSQEEEQPKSQFQVSFDKEEGWYFIDDEVVLLPKEVVTLEVHVKDVWVIEKSQIEALYREVDGLLEEWEKQMENSAGSESEEEGEREEETKEFALMMKGEILEGLDQIIQQQDQSKIVNVGVERHIAVFEDNMEELRQIQQDVVLLANLMQFDAQEEEGQEPQESELSEGDVQEVEELQDISQDEVVKDAKKEIEEL